MVYLAGEVSPSPSLIQQGGVGHPQAAGQGLHLVVWDEAFASLNAQDGQVGTVKARQLKLFRQGLLGQPRSRRSERTRGPMIFLIRRTSRFSWGSPAYFLRGLSIPMSAWALPLCHPERSEESFAARRLGKEDPSSLALLRMTGGGAVEPGEVLWKIYSSTSPTMAM